MVDPIYGGWGNRTHLKGAIKNVFKRIELNKQAAQLAPTQQSLVAELHRLGLQNDEGIYSLSGFMAEDILQSFPHAPDDVDILHSLPIYGHLQKLITRFFLFENTFTLPTGIEAGNVNDTSQLWMMEGALQRLYLTLSSFDQITGDIAQLFRVFVTPMIESNPQLLSPQYGQLPGQPSALCFPVKLVDVMQDLPKHIEHMVQLPFAPEFDELGSTNSHRERLEYNVIIASGGVPGDPNALRSPRLPTKAPPMPVTGLVEAYLGGTPLSGLFDLSVPITISDNTRFEHHHIVAGSGHGKTQTLQHLILHDLQQVSQGEASIVVLDSQGDLINNIASLSVFAPGGPLADRLVVIDPTDVEYPVALNLFDVGMERINQYSLLDRERMTNGILELYDFVLGSLLSAEMTQKQSVIFRYITRLLLHIPNATIHTLRVLLEEGGAEKYRGSIDKLGGSAKAFFDSEFDSREFVQTKRQVVRRLWGILENQTFERMFSHPKNKLDLYTEMNSGKVILINTAKDLLKENGTEIFGRFFIAMIAQAAQERSVIAEDQRMPTTVYIDEAQDYFDQNIGVILSQARKYKVGMVLAHQFLGQLDYKLQEAIFANTSIKFAGGVSAKDARALAGEMRCDASFIERHDKLSFAAFIRGTTKKAISLSITPGTMEQLPHMNQEQLLYQRQIMRERYAIHYKDVYTQSAGDNDERKAEESYTGENTSGHAAGEESPSNNAPLSGKPANWE